MIYPRLYTEADHGRWVDIINPTDPSNEIRLCLSDAVKRTNFLEDFKIVFRSSGATFIPQVRYERISGRNHNEGTLD
jgi:hypothetical protein